MVYCGKASLNCKNCRVRRIKCNRLEPECSQCVRAGKKCPGYRDQLTLMFRDETVKLKKKFDRDPCQPRTAASSSAAAAAAETSAAQVGQDQSPSSTPGASPRTPATTDSSRSGASSRSASTSASTRASSRASTRTGTSTSLSSPQKEENAPHRRAAVAAASALVLAPSRPPGDRGLQFYLDNYLYGHPESPGQGRASLGHVVDVVVDMPWIAHPPARTLAEAVGMEGLANLTGDRQLKMAAWQGYVAGLRQTADSLARAEPRAVAGDVRSIVLLAMFEMVRGNEPIGTANVHILGAAALMSKFFPALPSTPQPFRGLMQMCYSLLITYHATGTPVPPVVSGFVGALRIETEDEERMAALLTVLVDTVNMTAYLRRRVLVDGGPDAAAIAAQLLQLDTRLAAWEASVHGRPLWRVQTGHTTALPPEACYRGMFHRYHDIPTARIWGYYRWARILLSQLLLVVADQCPRAVAGALQSDVKGESETQIETETESAAVAGLQRHALQVIRACAEAILVSTPTHWRHPRVRADAHAQVASPVLAQAAHATHGSGAVGVFPILFHLQVAACAPGTPRAAWQWALGVVDTVWAQLGLEQARFLGSQMRAHRAALDRQEAQGVPELPGLQGPPEKPAAVAVAAAPRPALPCSANG